MLALIVVPFCGSLCASVFASGVSISDGQGRAPYHDKAPVERSVTRITPNNLNSIIAAFDKRRKQTASLYVQFNGIRGRRNSDNSFYMLEVLGEQYYAGAPKTWGDLYALPASDFSLAEGVVEKQQKLRGPLSIQWSVITYKKVSDSASKIIGTYKGKYSTGQIEQGMKTVFVRDADGNLSGYYQMSEGDAIEEGDLRDIQFFPGNSVTALWIDRYGSGDLVMKFSDDYSRFDGLWGPQGAPAMLLWSGEKQEDVVR